MKDFILVLQDKAGTTTLSKKINHQTIPKIGENLVYKDEKYEVFRVIHDLGYGEYTRIIVMVKPNNYKSAQLNDTNYNDFLIL